MVDAEQQQETPASFLNGVGENLQKTEGADTDLAKILSAHILTVPAGADAVAKAKKAIVALAESRAKPPEAANA